VLSDLRQKISLSHSCVPKAGLDGAHALPYPWNGNKLFEDRCVHVESAFVGNADASAGVPNISQGRRNGQKVASLIPVVSGVAPYTAEGAPTNGAPPMFEGYEERV
jgi:hypothetical protein